MTSTTTTTTTTTSIITNIDDTTTTTSTVHPSTTTDTKTTTTTTGSSSLLLQQIIQNVQLLLENNPSFIEYQLTGTTVTNAFLPNNSKSNSSNSNNQEKSIQQQQQQQQDNDDNVYSYASYLLSQSSSSSSSSNTNTNNNNLVLVHDIELQLTCIESFIQKLIHNVPELLTLQLLQLHGYNNNNNNNNTNVLNNDNNNNNNNNNALTTSTTSTSTNTNITLRTLCDSSIRIDRTSQQLLNTSTRIYNMILRYHTTISYHTNIILYHIIIIQYHMKYIIRILLELNKCCYFNYYNHNHNNNNNHNNNSSNIKHQNTEQDDDDDNIENDDSYYYYYYDWPRDVIRTATSITTVEELLSHLQQQQQSSSSSSSNKPIAVLEDIRPMIQYISQRVRYITKQKLNIVLQSMKSHVIGINTTTTTTTTYNNNNNNINIHYELSAILQIYYSLHELPEIIYYIFEQIYQIATLDVTRPLLLSISSSSSSSSNTTSSSSSSSIIETWSKQLRTCLQQIYILMDILYNKYDPISRTTKLYTALFTKSNHNNINIMDSIPKVYHEYINQYMMSHIIHHHHHHHSIPPITFFVSLFWYRYCTYLSQTLSDIVVQQYPGSSSGSSSSNSHRTSIKTLNYDSTTTTSASLISLYPALHIAAYTILQPLFQSSSSSTTTMAATNTEMTKMYSTTNTTSMSTNQGFGALSSSSSWSGFSSSSSSGGSGSSSGILGGTSLAILPFSNFDSMMALDSSIPQQQHYPASTLENPQSGSLSLALYGNSRSWTLPPHDDQNHTTGSTTSSYTNGTTLMATIKQSTEWKVYQGQMLSDPSHPTGTHKHHNTNTGLFPLQQAFVTACTDRLMVPLQYMFHENITISDDGVSMSTGILMLPSKYDLQRFDENIRQELSLATIGDGGSTTTSNSPITDTTWIVQLIAQCVNTIITEFCIRAKSAMSSVSHQNQRLQSSSQQQQQLPSQVHGKTESYINEKDWSVTEAMKHDCKIIAILSTMKQYLQTAPEKVFVAPYRPTGNASGSGNHVTLLHHTKNATVCTETLILASVTIDTTIKSTILAPFCRSLHRTIATNVLSKIQLGTYLDNTTSSSGGRNTYADMNEEDDIPLSFIQKDIVPILDKIVELYLVKFPPIYSSIIVGNVVSFIIYSYLSSVTLIRPLSESIRLHITQDLTDLEMALEQFLSKAAASSSGSKLNFTNVSTKNLMTSLQHIDHGKPYAELRAVRQMLFWTGLDTKSKPADDIAKSLANEIWVKDIRPSTIFHYLFSYGPNMLSSPYHVKRISATEYVALLVPYDLMFGYSMNHHENSTTPENNNISMESGEDGAFMTIMACCDSYTQRASVVHNVPSQQQDASGDPRIAQIVITFGQELLRRRGRQ